MEFFTPNERSLASRLRDAIAQLLRFGFYRHRLESVSKRAIVLWRTLSACRVETPLDAWRSSVTPVSATYKPLAIPNFSQRVYRGGPAHQVATAIFGGPSFEFGRQSCRLP